MNVNRQPRFSRPLFTSVALLSAVLGFSLLSGCGEQRFEPREAPDFELPLLDGSARATLSELQGQVVYLTFWASWCEPCRQEMPYLAQLWQRHNGEGFQILAINVDEDVELARKFVANYELPFTILRDEDRAVSKTYRVPGFPTHYIVDRRGRVRFSGLGFDLNDVRAVTQEVQTLLDEDFTAGASKGAEG
jgi:peroxiredoxin